VSDLQLDPTNLPYVENLYRSWKLDPLSVGGDWQEYFLHFDSDPKAEFSPSQGVRPAPASPAPKGAKKARDPLYRQSRVDSLIWAYRDVGYLYAKLNPLVGYLAPDLLYLHRQTEGKYERLTLTEFKLDESDLDTEFSAGQALKTRRGPLRDILKALDQTYCSSVGIEFLHIQDKPIRRWLITQMETSLNRTLLGSEHRHIIMEDLIKAEEFEHFLHSQYIGQKRFSLEGAEVLIPALHFLVDCAVYRGGEEIVLGMSHRGRLNVMANLLNKPPREIFSEFEAVEIPNLYGGSGDVRYHLGYQRNHAHEDGRFVSITLAPNPSHLESIDPVVGGLTRGSQQKRHDTGHKRVIPVLLHGDAAFSGQGIVAENFNLSQTRGYHTGGTIHIIVNNQIGFTTSTRDARSTFFPTDIAKIIPVPIFHVNGDDPEAVIHVINLALNFRQEFGRDVIIDIFCYRRHGHNEGDEPSFTHPRMYKIIKSHPSVTSIYGEQLAGLNIMNAEEQLKLKKKYRETLKTALEDSSSGREPSDSISAVIQREIRKNSLTSVSVETRIPKDRMETIVRKITEVPEDFHIHAKLERIINNRRKALDQGGPIDFPTAELLSFGSLLLEKTHIRLSGEDSGRGTFSQRHSVWWDIESEEPQSYISLNNISDEQAVFAVYDSPLSEYSILGFEYGYSLAFPDALVMWEAQFGDFSNGAQVIIDNYIISGEAKWNRTSRLVLLLPHGYEGQGPEHSSGHLERYLILCAQNNIQICNVTTPAQHFHLLRRQIRQNAAKPLILMTPKSLLRHPLALSTMDDLTHGRFNEVLDDPEISRDTAQVRNLYFCSGKVYFDLWKKRAELKIQGSVFIRIEQLYPFPKQQIKTILEKYATVHEVYWVQEEPKNRGAWTYIQDRFRDEFGIKDLRYIGREPSASPATGSHVMHLHEQSAIFDAVFKSVKSLKNSDIRKPRQKIQSKE
jgi:2-oxoglutarate dehydrogenase E1 component